MDGRRAVLFALTAALCAVLLVDSACPACTAFSLEGKRTVLSAKNYDWEVEAGQVVVNPRGLQKRAAASENPAVWTSRFGSVTFNQYGREFPCGGVNENGLVIEVLWLEETVYPADDARPAVSPLQWLQYLLDNCASVEEALAAQEKIRIPAGTSVPLHFFLCDESGSCAAVEFLEGETVVHTGKDLPTRVLTNHTYDVSRRFLMEHAGFGGSRLPAEGFRSKDRFVRTSAALAERKAAGGPSVDEAFAILDGVASEQTMWSIVYDLGGKRLYFRTHSFGAIREVDMNVFDFSCSAPALVLDMSDSLSGPVNGSFVTYTTEANRELIREAYGATDFLQSIDEETLESLARYPEAFPCADSPRPTSGLQ